MSHLDRLQYQVSKCQSTLAGHEERFKSGRNTMSDLRTQVSDLRVDIAKAQPERQEVTKWLGLALTVGGMVVGVVVWASNGLSERTTMQQVSDRIAPTAKKVDRLDSAVRNIEVFEAEQRALIESLRQQIAVQQAKIDVLSKRRRR